MTVMQNFVRKNQYYVHEILNRTWAILPHVKIPEELSELDLQHNFDWARLPEKKFMKVKVPLLVTSSFSSSHATDEAEDIEDTAEGPTPPTNPGNAGAPPPPSG